MLARSLSPCPDFNFDASDQTTDAPLTLPLVHPLCQEPEEDSVVLLNFSDKIDRISGSNYLHERGVI